MKYEAALKELNTYYKIEMKTLSYLGVLERKFEVAYIGGAGYICLADCGVH